jgi:hypothetical protein
MKTTLALTLCLLPFCSSMVSCKEKGPAERAGEKIDKAGENLKDAVDPRTPAEKAEDKVKDGVDKVGDKVDKALGH